MKKNNLTSGAFAVLLLASTVAGANQQYPAADFQPEVLYQDSDYIAKNSPKTTTTKSAAAAPKAAAASSSAESAHDSKYPAADFQPEVLYQDTNYKHTESAKASASKKEVASKTVESVSATEVTESTQESSFTSYLIGLIALALAGFYFFKIRSTATVQKKTSTQQSVKTSYALTTGVAKYLNRVSGTGVSRYLETRVKSASATGVAKYMAKQAASQKTTSAKAATGVEKYMRDRG